MEKLLQHRQAGPTADLLIKVREVGFEPPVSGDVSPLINFFAAIPLFFVGKVPGAERKVWQEMKKMVGRIVNCPHCGRILPEKVLTGTKSSLPETVKYPCCGNSRVWRDGKLNLGSEVRQRYYCRICGYRFSVL